MTCKIDYLFDALDDCDRGMYIYTSTNEVKPNV